MKWIQSRVRQNDGLQGQGGKCIPQTTWASLGKKTAETLGRPGPAWHVASLAWGRGWYHIIGWTRLDWDLQAGIEYRECRNQVAGIAYTNKQPDIVLTNNVDKRAVGINVAVFEDNTLENVCGFCRSQEQDHLRSYEWSAGKERRFY